MTLASRWASAVAAVALLGASTVSNAAIVVYTDRAAFLGAVFASGTDDFDDLPVLSPGDDPLASPLNRTAGAYAYRTSAADGFYPAGTPADRWLAPNTAFDAILFDGFASNVIGIGGFFFGSDLNGEFQVSDIGLTATSGSLTESRMINSAPAGSFLGFVSTSGALTSLRVTAVQPNAALSSFAWPTINDLTLGVAPPPTTVPEPATLSLLALGLGLIGLRRRRGPAR